MTEWFKSATFWAAGAATVVAVAAVAYFGLPLLTGGGDTSAPGTTFTKTAYDANGNPISGPVNVGDVIQYVLRYKVPAGGTAVPVTVDDTLSPNQSYVDPSIVASGWTWAPTPPYSVGNHTTYTHLPPFPGSFTMTITDAPASVPVGITGDGFVPIPVGSRVFSIFHHMPHLICSNYTSSGMCIGSRQDPYVMCWNASDLSKCTTGSYPANLTPTINRATSTMDRPTVVGSKIYYASALFYDATGQPAPPTGAANEKMVFDIGCWDTATNAECTPIPLPGTPSRTFTANVGEIHIVNYVAGLGQDPNQPNHLIIAALDKIHCLDASTGTPCWTTPLNAASAASVSSRDLLVEEGSSTPRVFVVFGGTSNARLSCFQLSSGAPCAGWSDPNGSAALPVGGFALSPYLNTSGTALAGVCVHGWHTNTIKCFDMAGASLANPFGSVIADGVIAAYHIPGTAKVLEPQYAFAEPVCFDFSTMAACASPTFAPTWSATYAGTPPGYKDYGYAQDPANPQCFFGLGHQEVLWRFSLDGKENAEICAPKTYVQSFAINLDDYCFKKPTHVTWTTVEIVGRPTELVGGTIVIKDSGGNVLSTTTVGSGNTYTVNATTNTDAITVEFTPDYGSNPRPDANYQIRVNYTADEDPQICYKARVDSCGDVFNNAVLHLPTGDVTADVNLGKAVGPDCPAEKPCLDVETHLTANKDGTGTLTVTGNGPNGFEPNRVTVHSLTPGVSVVPPATRHFGNGPINGTWQLTGLTPGQNVTVRVDAYDRNGGTIDGTDLCCSTTVTIKVPNPEDEIDLAIRKTMGDVVQGPVGASTSYTLSVTNVGGPVNIAGAIVVKDTVLAGLTFTAAGGTDWNCGSTFPLAAGATLTCTYTGTVPVAAGATLPPITVKATGSAPTRIENCAVVGLQPQAGAETTLANNRSCVNSQSAQDQPDITVIKSCDPCPTGVHCRCKVSITSNGPVSSPVTFTDSAIGTWTGPWQAFSSITHSDPWTCTQSSSTTPTSSGTAVCTLPAAAFNASGYSSEVEFVVEPGDPGNAFETVNCVAVPPATIDKSAPPDSHRMCVNWGMNLGITKVGPASCVAGAACTFTIAVTNQHGTAAFNGDINLGDSTPGLTVQSLTPSCTPTPTQTPFNCTTHVNLGPGQTATYTLTVKAPASGQNLQNCAQINSLDGMGGMNPAKPGQIAEGCATVPLTNAQAQACPPDQQAGPVPGLCVPRCRGELHWDGRRCVPCPDGQSWNVERKRCEQKPLSCDRRTTTVRGKECACRYDGMVRRSPTECACAEGSRLVPGRGCVRPEPECDPKTMRTEGRACVCRYDGMTLDPRNSRACTCPQGTSLQDGKGCVAQCPPHATFDARRGRCVCPSNMKMVEGQCREKTPNRSILDNIDINIGIQPGTRRDTPRRDTPRHDQPARDPQPARGNPGPVPRH